MKTNLRYGKWPLCVVAMAVGAFLSPVFAQDAGQQSDRQNTNALAPNVQPGVNADAANVFTLGTVVVYGASQTAAEQSESFISREKIDLFEKKDVGTALSRVPGVFYNYARGGRYESNVMVRGYGLRYVPIYIDGIPVYIPYDGYSDMGRFTTADISSIQVAKGYSSVMYGHNTMAGAINIVTMRPRSELDFTGTVGTGEGSVAEVSANLGSMQDSWYFQVGASSFERRYTRLSESVTERNAQGNFVYSDKYAYTTRDRRGSIRLGWVPNATDEYVISYSKQEAQKYPGPSGTGGFLPTTWEWPSWDRETISFVSNTRFWDDQFYIKPRIYYDRFENMLVGFRGSPQGSHYDDKALGASLEIGTQFIHNNLFKLLLSYKRETHSEFNTYPNSSTHVPNTYSEASQKFYSIGLEDTITISPHWEAQLGALYTRRSANATGIGTNTQALIAAYPAANSMLAPSINATDLEAALFYKPTENHTFRFSIARKTRFPSFKEVYSNYASGSTIRCPRGQTGCTAGTIIPQMSLQNPGLNPEQAMNYEIGYVGTPLDGLQVEGSIFLSRAKDAIGRSGYDYNTFPGYAVRQTINFPGTTERRGFELGMDYEFNRFLTFGGTYTYIQARNKSDSSLHISGIPRHFGTLYAQVTPVEWLHIIPSMEARSSSYASTTGNDKDGGFALYNLKLSLTPSAWRGVALNIGADNIFNKNYAGYNDSYPSPGRYIYANLRFDFH